MTFAKLVDDFYNYLKSVNFGSSEDYRSYLKSIYNEFPRAKSILNSLAKESDNGKQVKLCIKLIELIFSDKEKETDKKKKHILVNWHSVAMKLVDYIQSLVVAVPEGYLTERNIHAIFDGEIGLTFKKPYNLYAQGKDQETGHITYGENVTAEEQVPGLCFSLEHEYECILGFARELFGDALETQNIFRRIPVELRKECPAKLYLNSDEYVTEKINELVEKCRTIEVAEVQKILRHEMRILGKFFEYPEPHIVIYYKQIEAENDLDYLSQISQVLAHEYLHYLEYARCAEVSATPFLDERVSEGIADFFGVLYSIMRGRKYDLLSAKNRYDNWVKYWGSNWPYANALWFYKISGRTLKYTDSFSDYVEFGSIQKLQGTFALIDTPVSAYNALEN